MDDAKRILVIEDDGIFRELLADWLGGAGYHVTVAPEGAAGIAEARAHRPALVVTDIHMPGIGGAAVITAVKRMHPDVPVVAISGHFRSGHGLRAEAAIALGAARTLAKPFKRNDMLSVVLALVGPPPA